MLTLTLLKDRRQVHFHPVDGLALRLVDAHCPSKDQWYLYTQIGIQNLRSFAKTTYLLTCRLDISKTINNLEFGRSEKKKKTVFLSFEFHNWPLLYMM
jgi:hypothetical protein